MTHRSVFFISDRTGITAEMFGRTLLTQFDGFEFKQTTLRFIDTIEKAQRAVERINRAAEIDGVRPLLFCTLIDDTVRALLAKSNGLFLDFFSHFIKQLENELHTHSATVVGRSHGMGADAEYKARIDAVNFALSNDDGVSTRDYPLAEIILIGVSRSGKTPTCLYLALQYGITAANYPLTEEDLNASHLPMSLEPYRNKLFGLTIHPQRLHQIRVERRANSRYASLQQCKHEVQAVETIYRNENIPHLDTSHMSIEEIATSILHTAKLERRLHG